MNTPSRSDRTRMPADEDQAAEILLSTAPQDDPEVLTPDGSPRVGKPVRMAKLARTPRRARPSPALRRSGRRVFLIVAGVLLVLAGLTTAGVLWAMKTFDDYVTANAVVVRLAPGEHQLTGTVMTPEWGELATDGGFVPATVVRGTPKGDDTSLLQVTDVTPGVRVSRTRGAAGVPETRPLEAALGSWLDLGVSNTGEVKAVIRDSGGKEAKDRYRYTLLVPPGLTLAATSPLALGGTESRLKGRDGVADATRTLDEYAAKLRAAFGPESGVVREFAERQAKVEGGFYAGSDDPRAAATACVAEHTDWLNWKRPDETLYWLSVVHGRVLTPEQIAAAKKLYPFPIADSYSEAKTLAGNSRAAAPVNPLLMLSVGLIAPNQPDDFEGIINMLLWVTDDCVGPKVTLISERVWSVGDITYTEQTFEYEWRRTRRQSLEAFVRNAYAKMRINGNARPAADLLFGIVVDACRANGPMSPWPEHVHNLDLAIDMRTHPNGEWQGGGKPDSSRFNAMGFARDNEWYWKEALRRHPEMFSTENKRRIGEGNASFQEAPLVDKQWVEFNPQDASYQQDRVGDTQARLDHHHLAQGPIAVPMPAGRHRDNTKALHPLRPNIGR